MIVWRDGDFIDADSAVSARDRGWLIGDAAFETILVEQGLPAFLDEHLMRLARGCAIMGLNRPVDSGTIRAAIAGLAAQNAISGRAACRLTISRVGGPRGLAPSREACVQATLALSPAPAPPAVFRLVISMRRRWSGASTNGFKCVGAYAENVLARAEAGALGADEAIMLNERGRAASACAANIFALTNDRVLTPPVSEGAMPGIVRAVILREARRLGLKAEETPLEPGDLASATVLLTNSIAGAVRSALDNRLAQAGEKAAAILIGAYQRRLAAEFAGNE